jgi:hypothetical protein
MELIEIIDFQVNKDSATLKVLTIENDVEQHYQMDFSDVVAFDFWKAPLDLNNDELEVDVDDKYLRPLKEIAKYKNMEYRTDLINKIEVPNEFWYLEFMGPAFRLSVVFRNI